MILHALALTARDLAIGLLAFGLFDAALVGVAGVWGRHVARADAAELDRFEILPGDDPEEPSTLTSEDRAELGRLREQNHQGLREVEERDSLIDRLRGEAKHDRVKREEAESLQPSTLTDEERERLELIAKRCDNRVRWAPDRESREFNREDAAFLRTLAGKEQS